MPETQLSRGQLGLLAGAAALAAAVYIRSGGWTLTQRRLLEVVYNTKGAFQLVIPIKFKSEQDRDRWLELWKPLAQHCWQHEPQTLAYEASVGDQDPLKVIVFERYTNRQALTAVHQKSQPFLRFKEQAADISVEREGISGLETRFGYM